MSELDAIRRFAARYPFVGDDAAVLPGGLLAAADAVVEGVDFDRGSDLADVGWRAIAVNASDVAAMGGRPEWWLVTVAGPASTDLGRLYEGIDEACAAFGGEVVGGDLSNAAVLAVAVTVLGRVPEGGTPVLRSGARAGDVVWVSGPLGGAAASGYRARPVARVDVGRAVAGSATAMIDVSDGFALDLARLCDASNLGVDVEDVPVADGATQAQALSGGDDYELLFTLPPGVDPPEGCLRVGVMASDLTRRPEGPAGWQHRFS